VAYWYEEGLMLGGVSHIVGGDPYHIRVYVPEGYRATTEGVQQDGRIAVLTLLRKKNVRIRWSMVFEKVNA
jgi:hypothetical protein